MIAIVDYGVGNLFSLSASLGHQGINSVVTANAETIKSADKIILPGVGAFADAIKKLRDTGLVPVLDECVAKGVPLLGICLGMQLLFQESDEYGIHKGLGYLRGRVCDLTADISAALKVPHMGWNSLRFVQENHPLLRYIKEGDYVYYVHSYYAKECTDSVIAASSYGVDVPGIVGKQNVFGTQFHPEKSGEVGLAILQAFSEF